jgi:uncharacterized ferredoxin-like protein
MEKNMSELRIGADLMALADFVMGIPLSATGKSICFDR